MQVAVGMVCLHLHDLSTSVAWVSGCRMIITAGHTAESLPVRMFKTLIRASPVTHTSGSPFSAWDHTRLL